MTDQRQNLPERDPNIRKHDFSEVTTGFDEKTVVLEASRCLGCKNAPCTKGCPVSVRIPEMMAAVKKGGDRQELHEKIRQHSMAAGQVVKAEGKPNDLPERIAADPAFGMTLEEIRAEMVPQNFIGRAPQQVTEFLKNDVQPILEKYKDLLGLEVEIKV